MGTGAIVDARGYVLTNWHVIKDHPDALIFLKPANSSELRHANCRCALEIYSQARLQAKREAQHRLVELIIPREREVIETELPLIPSKSEAARMKLA